MQVSFIAGVARWLVSAIAAAFVSHRIAKLDRFSQEGFFALIDGWLACA
jgi:hypothetical protein